MISSLLLEQELRRSCILTDESQIKEICDLVTELINMGLIKASAAPRQSFQDAIAKQDGERSLCQPSYDGQSNSPKYLVRFADAEVGDCYFDDEGEARGFFESAIMNWNCYLFGLLEK